MKSTHRSTLAVTAVIAMTAGGALAVAGAASAATSASIAKPVHTAAPAADNGRGGKTRQTTLSPALAAAMPQGYAVVHSGSLSSPAGTQVHGSVACPAPKVALGGGVFFSSGSVLANINSSYPAGSGWAADVNNASASASSFTVYAICGHKPKKYAVVAGTLTAVNPAAKPLSGGLFSDSLSTLANVNSSIPTTNGWRIDANNASSAVEHVRAYVVCGRVPTRHVATSAATVNAAGTQTGATALCGTGVPVGGGAFSGSGSTVVSINTTYPVAGGWRSYLNNNSSASETFTTYVVCSG